MHGDRLALLCRGAFLFVPAAQMRVYGIFLAALYIIAIGAGFLETSANPYIAIMGDPATSLAAPELRPRPSLESPTGVGPAGGRLCDFLPASEYTPAQMAAMGRRRWTVARAGGCRRRSALSCAGHSDAW
jgi:FHS family L-fucose permease-like MFS transporter